MAVYSEGAERVRAVAPARAGKAAGFRAGLPAALAGSVVEASAAGG